MLNDELDLVNSLTATLSSFKEDPGMVARHRGRPEESSHVPHDPDVWAPPTPVEPRYTLMLI